MFSGSSGAPSSPSRNHHYSPTSSSLSPGALVKSGQSYAHTGPYCEFWRYQLLIQCEHRIAVWLQLCDSTFSSVFSRASGATTKVVGHGHVQCWLRVTRLRVGSVPLSFRSGTNSQFRIGSGKARRPVGRVEQEGPRGGYQSAASHG